MKIAFVCNDTRGGIQPYLGLAQAFAANGHHVRVVLPENFITGNPLPHVEYHPLTGKLDEFVKTTGGVAERGTVASMKLMLKHLPKQIQLWTKQTWQACEGVDVICGGIGGMVIGQSVAEKLGVPFIECHLQPVGVRVPGLPGVLLPRTPALFHGLSFWLSETILWTPFKRQMKKARREVLGLRGPMPALTTPVLYGLSPHVVPIPNTDARPRIATGYWTLPAPTDWQPPQELVEFIRRPGPIVSVGFGSMASGNPDTVATMVNTAAQKANVPVVLLSGWSEKTTNPNPERVYMADSLPHDWLFPQMSAVVHHGGAGTTGAGFLAGVPAIVVPFLMDQPYWAKRVHDLGCGPKPIPRKKLNADNLANALRECLNDKVMQANAKTLGEKMRQEEGVKRVIKETEKILTSNVTPA